MHRRRPERTEKALAAPSETGLYAEKTDATPAGKAFDLEHLGLSAKDRNAIPMTVYEKAKADDIVKERFGAESLWLNLKDLWGAYSDTC